MQISFTHNYPKLWEQETAILLAVLPIKIDKNTHTDLIEYDTKISEGEYFNLKAGKYIQLVFIGNKRIPFCTIRSAFPQSKVDYYNKNIGKEFLINIREVTR